jgi:hypothetical protein
MASYSTNPSFQNPDSSIGGSRVPQQGSLGMHMLRHHQCCCQGSGRRGLSNKRPRSRSRQAWSISSSTLRQASGRCRATKTSPICSTRILEHSYGPPAVIMSVSRVPQQGSLGMHMLRHHQCCLPISQSFETSLVNQLEHSSTGLRPMQGDENFSNMLSAGGDNVCVEGAPAR